jgi:predicted O-methyltransferase YrrM
MLKLVDKEAMNHEHITSIITDNGRIPYGVGITPNPFVRQQAEWERRRRHFAVRKTITEKIESLFEPRFITPPETSELIESIITITDSRTILEIGVCTGFTTLHMLRAVYGKHGARIVAVEARPAHDREFWSRSEFRGCLEFMEGWTPEILESLRGSVFDLVFVDSDHSVDHTASELGALWSITRPGTIFLFHDVPEWQTPSNRVSPPVRDYLFSKVSDGTFQGIMLPSCEQMDCLDAYGPGYPMKCNPGLGIFIRK